MVHCSMRIVVVSFMFLLPLVAVPARANIRAPYFLDGTFTEHIRGAHPDVVLLRERFVARLPRLVVGDRDPRLEAPIALEYDVENTSAAPVVLPVRFLALGADDARICLNGVEVAHERVEDDDERRAALARIEKHRCAWQANEVSGRGFPPCPKVDDLERAFDRRGRAPLDSLRFTVELAPGRNTIAISYRQQLRVSEGAYGYFSGFGARGAELGFEYLLYPAKSWRRADNFRFDVRVEVPDVKAPGLFWDSYIVPEIRTNLPLKVEHMPHPAATATASLSDFPAEVFAVVVRVPAG